MFEFVSVGRWVFWIVCLGSWEPLYLMKTFNSGRGRATGSVRELERHRSINWTMYQFTPVFLLRRNCGRIDDGPQSLLMYVGSSVEK